MQTKIQLRQSLLRKRSLLSQKEVEERSLAAGKRLFSLEEFQKGKIMLFYVSVKNEVSTRQMIAHSLHSHKRVCVPLMIERSFLSSEIHALGELDRKSSFGIPEPSAIRDIVPNSIDVFIIPGIGFDRKGGRLGYGYGYFDSFLKKCEGLKVGLCYGFQLVEDIPRESWDVGMDYVITEKEIVKVKRVGDSGKQKG